MYFCGLKKKYIHDEIFIPNIIDNIRICLFSTYSHADSWRDKTELLIYSPRYFGPNAFPIPEMRDGRVSERYEVEVRGECHYYTGDKTWDIVGRALLPFFRGRAGIEVTGASRKNIKMTPETRDERFAVDTESPIKYNGDIVIQSFSKS